MTQNNTGYTADSINVLEGLEAVRKRPGMYIGSTDSRGLHHMVYEIFDNSVDEAINGHGNKIEVTITAEDGIRVKDYGRGMPVDEHSDGKSAVEILFTVLHAGGKFGQGGYKTTGGLHGVGASVVNALSKELEATVRRDGKVHNIKFADGGKTVQELTVIGECDKDDTGTEVYFLPDPEIFSQTKYKAETLATRLRETAFLNKGLEIVLRDERKDEVEEEVFMYEGGIADFVEYLNTDKNVVSPVEYMQGVPSEDIGIEVEIGLQWNDGYQENVLSFVNNVRTRDGGTHETGFRTALTKAVNEVGREREILKKRDKNLEGGDIREGLVGIVSVKVPEEILEFEGQTKSKLGTNIARRVVETFFFDRMKHFLNENPKVAEELIEKAKKAQNVREEAKKAREKARTGKKVKRGSILSGKLTDATSRKRETCELFIVEGDSAGGTAKSARERTTQAILPLRGKVLNTEQATYSQVMKNREIVTITESIGAGFGQTFDVEESRYGKVIIMTDADVDGSHIQVLLVTLFKEYMRDLINKGMLYIAVPPLFAVVPKKKELGETHYAWSNTELQRVLESVDRSQYEVTRFKGLGEMNEDQLWDTTMNPENRKLIQVVVNDEVESAKIFDTLMGKNAEERKHWIEENVEFNGVEE